MRNSLLSEHKFSKKEKGVLKTPLSEHVTLLEKEVNWNFGKSAEYIWLALILNNSKNRRQDLINCMEMFDDLNSVISDEKFSLPTLSNILSFNLYEQKYFVEILERYGFIGKLAPLSLILDSKFLEYKRAFKCYVLTIEERLSLLEEAIQKTSSKYSQLSTDIKYLNVYFLAVVKDKLRFVNGSTSFVQNLNNYLEIEDNNFREMIEVQLSSIDASFAQVFSDEYKIASELWNKLGKYFDCEGLVLEFEEQSVDMNRFKNEVYKGVKYYKELSQNFYPLDERLYVLSAILMFSYKRLIELVDHNLSETISGRSILRSCLESLMISKYLLANEENIPDSKIWEQYKNYGLGNYKLIYERYFEKNPEIEIRHINHSYLNYIISEFSDKEFLDIDTRYFGGGKNIRSKFKEVGLEDLYIHMYEYDSQFEHAEWGAIRESSILKCDTPGHHYHGILDIENEQKLPSVNNDIQFVFKMHFDILDDYYPNPHNSSIQGESKDD
ncbi:hypothetical protein HMPREF2758_06835 [Facklamia sp. HMSC062C11]|uniref:DUF5677 domain-containing protein n=1 Tax=Facklamia TaxID=66831 RepID=UPI0008A1CEE3|nr:MULTISPECIES: DUF5677 domain-containing protein [Facklamia]OFL66852.1 hypothetical protein HMPREF2758_06835 [Facklamia sp. HMSC062C11]WPJ91659.1 DUF5677 domain-containing protein [Facklamia hominis]